jgi:2-polyprenyl-6-methoxyphenol hydroxylase-like FAD-dependent oxidoreductase
MAPAGPGPDVVRVRRLAAVVGGGIGGLAAAVALRSVGWDVTVLERAPELREAGVGIGLWPNAIHALESINANLARALRQRWALQGTMGMRAVGGRWLVRLDGSWVEQRYGAPVVLVARPVLHTLLTGLVPEGAVRLGCTVGGAHRAGPRAVVTGDGPAGRLEIQADLVVAADGVRSALRTLVDPRAAARYAGHTAWRALISSARVPQVTDSSDTWGQGGRFGYARMGDGCIYWFASARAAPDGVLSPGELRALCGRFAGWHEPIPALLAATPPAALVRHDVFHLNPPPRRLAAGRIALLGDAGHAMTPDLGQGACQALEDAAELAAVVAPAQPADIPAALGRYDAARRARTLMIMHRSRSVARLAHLQGKMRCALRDHLMAAAASLPRNRALDEVLGWRPSP